MNKDFRVAITFADHPKTLKLMRRCGDKACWCLMRFWGFVAANKPDGKLGAMDDEDIEIASGWIGDPGQFVKAMRDLRMLEGESGHYSVHEWEEHNSFAAHAQARSDKASKAAKAKWDNAKTCSEHMLNDARSNAKTCSEICPSPSPTPSPNPQEEERVCAEVNRNPPKLDRASKASRPGDWQGFRSIWEVYPLKQDQEAAWNEYCRLKDNGTLESPGIIRDKIIELKTNDSRWLRGIGITSLAKWLAGKRWNDEPFIESGEPPGSLPEPEAVSQEEWDKARALQKLRGKPSPPRRATIKGAA